MNVRQVIPPDTIPSVDDPTFEAAYAGDAHADDPDDRIVVVESVRHCHLPFVQVSWCASNPDAKRLNDYMTHALKVGRSKHE